MHLKGIAFAVSDVSAEPVLSVPKHTAIHALSRQARTFERTELNDCAAKARAAKGRLA